MEGFPVTLPSGLWRAGARHSQATLRYLTGADEAFLIDHGEHLTAAARTTALLARCLLAVGDVAPIDEAVARDLTVGDREALLLRLRAALLGDRIDAVIECPAAGCGEKLEVTISISDLLQPAYDAAAPEYEEALGSGDSRLLVRFRLPTGADQEAVAPLARSDPAAAGRGLLERCVLSVAGRAPDAGALDEVGAAVADRWEQLDPQAETRLQFSCPACGADFETALDAGAFLFEELAARRAYVFTDVDALARTYHWSEAEILALAPERRRRYVELATGAAR